MISTATISPYLFSFILGYFAIGLMRKKEEDFPLAIHSIFSFALGMGISAQVTFLSFILFDQLIPFFVLTVNLIIAGTLGLFYFQKYPLLTKEKKFNTKFVFLRSLPLIFILILFIPLIKHSSFYVHGGWDAWSVWNVKAKFMYLGGSSWDNMFKPMLWRSSPHYPLLLPLINVWGWIFTKAPVFYIPQLTAILFSLLTVSLLWAGIKDLTKSKLAFIPVLLFVSSPYIIKQCISQYCDLIFGFYLLASIYCLIKATKEGSASFSAIAGIFLGFLTFTKGEGLLAAGLIGILSIPYLWLTCSNNKKVDILATFLVSAFLASTPLLYFKLFYAPGNETFTNGLISQTNPSTFERLKAILFYYFFELKSPKWNGLLLAVTATLLLNIRSLIKKENLFLALFLFAYFSVITFYYYVNTQFEIIWWLNVTIGRIIFAVLPVILFLAFLCLLKNKNQ